MTATQPPTRVVGSAPAPKVTGTARVPLRFLPVPRQRRVSRLRVGQVVTAQLVLVAVASSLAGPTWLTAAVGGTALLVLAVVFGRRRGRWWYENTALHRRFSRRRRSAQRALALPSHHDPRLAALAPGMSVREVEERGNQFGVGRDQTGWYAAFMISPPTGAEGERRLVEAVDRLGQILVETDAPVSSLQLAHHTVPVATLAVPAGQWVWVALRLDARDAAAAAASRGGGVDGVHRALAAAVGRVQKSLRAAGVGFYRVLTADELSGAVAAVGGWGAPGTPAVNPAPAERWTAWHGPDASHVCFRLSGVPNYSLSHLVAGLRQSALLSFTVSVLLYTRDGEELQVDALLRVALADSAGSAVMQEVAGLAARIGLDLTRLDGEHGPAVYASAPTGHPVVR